jgi:hypothetical protein
MTFNEEYESFIRFHIENSQGERRRRLEDHGHAERLFLANVWWSIFGSFDYLHPEYEYRDFEDKIRFLDYAYLRPPFYVGYEIVGFGPHWRDITRWQFADQQMRHNYLTCDGWLMFYYAYDDVNEKYRRCQRSVLDLFSRLWGVENSRGYLTENEKSVIKLTSRHDQITVGEVKEHLRIGRAAATTLLKSLAEKTWLIPCKGGKVRVHAYRLNPESKPFYYML